MTTGTALPRSAPVERGGVPITRAACVWRDGLIRHLEGAHELPVVSMVAPAGYGKTTALAQWASHDGRPFAWLTIDRSDNDPVLLLGRVNDALECAEIVEPPSARSRLREQASIGLTSAAQVRTVLAEAPAPFVLVLDDVHLVTATESLEALRALADQIPPGSQVVLSGRSEETSVVVRLRASRQVLDVGPGELALTPSEARALLSADGVERPADVVHELVSDADGWAAGLYLETLDPPEASLAPAQRGARGGRFVDDYVRTEHLSGLSTRELAFLTQSSVLDRLGARICDAVLGRRDSARMLGSIERSHLFLVPLDREREWYRYRGFIRSALRRELDRTDPGAADDLLRRASDWCEAHHLLEEAMSYAVASDDLDRMAHLLVSLALPLSCSDRRASVEGWLDRFDDGALLDRYPEVAIVGSLAHALGGRLFKAGRWLDVAKRAEGRTGPHSDGSASLRPWIATGEAMLCRHGPDRMRRDAELAVAELEPLSSLRPVALWLLANALLLQGDAGADRRLEEALDAADRSGDTFVGATAASQRALLVLERDDLPAAQVMVSRSRAAFEQEHVQADLPPALLLVAEARTAISSGDSPGAERALSRAQRLRPELLRAIPFHAVQTLVEMARSSIAIGDLKGARAVLFDAGEVLRHHPELAVLEQELATLRKRTLGAGRPASAGAATLTAAELRLLPLLTTHLTFEEIGKRLFVSRNTVKTHAISIYRKLGVSSRGDAVERAVELGLAEAALDPAAKIISSG